MKVDERLERLRKTILALVDDNSTTPVLVEGRRDESALRDLGLEGEILVYNSGRSILETAEHLARKHPRVIVLFDWDRTGGHLTRRLQEHVHAQVELDLSYRKEFAVVSGVRSVEDLPSALEHIRIQADRRAAAKDE